MPSDTREASAPFNKPTADFVIRSSDNVDFLVQSAILAEASPSFANMFSVSQPPVSDSESTTSQDTDKARPVIPVTESSNVLDRLFRICYPVRDPTFTHLRDVRLVLEAHRKRRMLG